MNLSLDLSVVVTRISDQVAALKKVGEAADLASAEEDIKNKIPAAYVVPLREGVSANKLVNAVSQRVTEGFSVALAISNVRDTRGVKAVSDLRTLRAAVQDALVGWTPDANVYDIFEYGGGRLLSISATVMWWMLEFRTTYYVRKT